MKNSRRTDYRLSSRNNFSAIYSAKQATCATKPKSHATLGGGAAGEPHHSSFLPPLSTPSSSTSFTARSGDNSWASLPSSNHAKAIGLLSTTESPQTLRENNMDAPKAPVMQRDIPCRARESSKELLSTETTDNKDNASGHSSDDTKFNQVETRVSKKIRKGDYTGAYIDISASLSLFDAKKGAHRAKLLAYRASCSFRLMNYSECQEDCAASLSEVWSSPRGEAWASGSGSDSGNGGGPSAITPFGTWISFLIACVMRQEYMRASTLADGLLKREDRAFNQKYASLSLSPSEVTELQLIQNALPSVELLRECVLNECWEEALSYVKEATPLMERTPLSTLQATVLLENHQAEAARNVLLPYVPCISPPLVLQNRPETPELAQLRQHIDPHYVLANILLAKASLYCGRPYVNIAASLVQLCLRVQPQNLPAMKVGNYIISLEDYFTGLEAASRRREYQRVVQIADEALTLDPQNGRINALFFHERAVALLALKKPVRALEDCTRSIAADGSNAKVYATRAAAYQTCGKTLEAAADRTIAVNLNPAYQAVFEREAELAKQQDERRTSPSPPPLQEDVEAPPPPSKFKWQRTLYDELGLSPSATKEAIKSAYHRLVLTCHPDKLAGVSVEIQREAVEKFKLVNHAYNVLSDPYRRSAYDQTIIF